MWKMCTWGEGKEKMWEMTGRSHFPSLSSLSPSNRFPLPRCCNSCPRLFLDHLQIVVVLLFLNHEMHEMFCHFVFFHRSNTVPDPDLEIRGEGLLSPPRFFQFGPKIREGGAQAPPLDPPLQHNLVPRASSPSTSDYSVLLMSFSKYHNCLTNLVNVTCSLLWRISWGICASQKCRNMFNEWR